MATLSENPIINVVTAASSLNHPIDLSGSTPADKGIQAVIDSSPHGALIYFPAGVYQLTSTIALKFGQRYVGANNSTGPNGTIMKQASGANLPALFASFEYLSNSPYTAEAITIEHMSFDGNSYKNSTRVQWKDEPHSTSNAYGVNNGIILMGYRSTIRQCFVFNVSGCGIIVASMSQNGSGLTNTSVENRIEDCIIEGFGYYGLLVSGATGSCTDGYIRDCIVDGDSGSALYSGSDCIRLNNGAGWFLAGNHVYGGAENGIQVYQAFATTLLENEVDGYGNGPAFPFTSSPYYYTGIGVTCNSGVRGTVLTSNVIYCSENQNVHYQHLCLSADFQSDSPKNENTRIIASNNIVIGNYQSSRPMDYSVGIVIQNLSSQNVPNHVIVFGNRVDNVGYIYQTYVNGGILDLAPVQIIGSALAELDVQSNRHFIAGSTHAPQVSKGSNNNSTFFKANVNGNDIRGVVTFTSGSTSGELLVVTFAVPYSTPPVVLLTLQGATSSSVSPVWYINTVKTTGFSICSTNNSNPGTYTIGYAVIG
ncbi:glycosyl hydrolase family 28-related protein [Tengunoibacter tsumagoiensis]|uniref:Rhamnogalacturonase A/B/Epimerase-like pectate lyase domain-containing protein n=1 Tax=Tengunoibacter tsumagoiensis TaxID=2014871 RepID=A0A402A9U0_9CHLR|nr:glycosyl hydrolase family 28-related protein [Tengunoibacter tsumagoiensis]GCE15937.1 hypothetical protein KTT_57960 [Tengunoibacter tsumagoiensis]